MAVPEPFAPECRIATNHEIRSWSFGRITKARVAHSAPLDDHVGTLTDQRIFGPLFDHRCACGKYNGAEYDGMICDRCGVKITTVDACGTRFGHIDFAAGPVQHPFDSSTNMDCIPVIPAVFLQSQSGVDLCLIYEQLLTDPTALVPLIDDLIPMAAESIQWNAKDSCIFTRGIGLTQGTAT